jgi:hypothetical protein
LLLRHRENDSYMKKWEHFYRDYRDKCKELKKVPLPYATHREFLKKFLKLVIHKIVDSSFIFQMPYGLGHIRLNESKGVAYGPSNLRIKAWDKHFRFNWDKTLAWFKYKDVRLYKPGHYMQNLRKQKILLANEDPYEKDISGFVQNKYRHRLDYMRAKYPSVRTKYTVDEI